MTHVDRLIKTRLNLRETAMPDEVKQRINNVLDELPQPLQHERRKPGRALPRYWAASLIGGVVLLSSIIVFNTNTFADSVRPFFQSIFGMMGDNGLAAGTDSSSEIAVLAERVDQGYIFRVHEVKFDGLRISYSYSISKEDGSLREQYVEPSFSLDPAIKKLSPGILMSDSGRINEQNKIGIVNYYLDREIQGPLQLKVNISQLSFSNTGSDWRSIKGDWSFEAVLHQSGSVTERKYGEQFIAADKDIIFQLVKSRLSPNAAVWSMNWKLPRGIVDEKVNRDLRYGIKYEVQYDRGRSLAVLTRNSDGRIVDRELPVEQWLHEEKVTLYTEPVPEGCKLVTITPVLIIFPKEGSNEPAVEKPLRQFAFEVPIDQ
ncbi:hypothetical protein PAECIP111893_00822 [Paenibacillus plantiphilus]|uniref:DUF4179 domain-containing protein n=1 Tax=Paenibacillus plantiphilus TaxID=2905650 RepID=A0ABN8G2Q4_9BACL|nr:DUF4179 domain-containing protein [Paenibacillus plantiphilus]CAH1197566.1 hypothetical protein PAECIP111893_00822 [Paenibacillus plantiphilus]